MVLARDKPAEKRKVGGSTPPLTTSVDADLTGRDLAKRDFKSGDWALPVDLLAPRVTVIRRPVLHAECTRLEGVVESTGVSIIERSDFELEVVAEPHPASEDGAAEPAEVPRDRYFAKFGTFMLLAQGQVPSSDVLKERLESAIRADNRISSTMPVVVRKEWIYSTRVYPKRRDTTEEALFSGKDGRNAIRLSDPVAFTVTVPIKNQPEFRGFADIPTDTYYVSWDGITAIVIWPRQADDRKPPRSGGHVVVDILRDLSKAVGMQFYAQACSPGCTNMFAHRVMRIERIASGEISLSRVKAVGFPCVDAHLHCVGDPPAVAAALAKTMGHEAYTFAIFKNYARRIRDLEKYSRSMVDDLLRLNHDRIERSQLTLFKRVKVSWSHRSDKRRVRLLMSSLWLVLARIEALRTDWLQKRGYLFDVLERRKFFDLFRGDQGDDDKAIMSQDLRFIGTAVEQTASRLDAHAIARTTGLVALAGLLGGIIGGLLTSLLS